MKKITLLLLLLAVSFTGFSQTTIASYTFDADTESWLSAGATPVYDAANYYTAVGSVSMVADNNKLISTPKLNITTPGTYTFTLRVKGAVGTSVRTQFKEIDNGNLSTNGDTFVIPASGGDTGGDGGSWFVLTQTEEISVTGEVTFRLQNKSGSTETFYFDDVTIVKEAATGNVLTVDTIGSGSVALTLNKINYDPTDVETLTANAPTHWDFDSWTGDLTGSTNPETLLMDADKTVTANFTIDPAFDYAFTFDTDGELEGWTFDSQISLVSHTGGLVTLSITADQWSRFNLFDFPIPATILGPTGYNKVTIVLKNEEPTTDQLAVTLGPDNNTITYPLASQATFQTFEIDLTQFADWTGDIESFRIRFADADNPDATGRPSVSHDVVIDSVVFTFDASLSVNDVNYRDDASITLYPNPVSDIFRIDSPLAIEKIEVFNVLGQKAMSANSNTVDASGLAKGVYILKVYQENDILSTKRFIKQ